MLAALYRNSLFDRAVNIITLSSISFPEFFVAYILIYWLAQSGMFPSIASVTPGMGLGERLHACFLPALTLTLVVTAHMMRMTRAAIINLLASPYIEMARLKGLTPRRVIVKHALPNALAPIINVVALNLAYLITGVVVVEVVFVYPGLGQLMVELGRQARRAGGAGGGADLRRRLRALEPDRRRAFDPVEPAAGPQALRSGSHAGHR